MDYVINLYVIGDKVNQLSEACFKRLYHTTAFCIGYNYVLQEDLLNNIVGLTWIDNIFWRLLYYLDIL